MTRCGPVLVVGLFVAGAGVCSFGVLDARAQERGDTIVFAVPADTPISLTADKLIYIARPGAFVDVTSCAADGDARPTQTVVVVDPSGGGATRISGVVTIAYDAFFGRPILDALRNGTKLGNFRDPAGCSVNGESYLRYTATVE